MSEKSAATFIPSKPTAKMKQDIPPSFIEMRYQTCECGSTFYKDTDLNKHFMETNHKIITRDLTTYQCNICTKVLDDRNSILQHHAITHQYNIDSQRLSINGRVMVTKKICNICNKVLKSNLGLLMHMSTHTGDKPHKCELCDKLFASKFNLKHHLNSHTGNRPFPCKECTMTFANPSNLRRHMMVHRGIRPHVCEKCNKGFYTKFDVKIHQKRMH